MSLVSILLLLLTAATACAAEPDGVVAVVGSRTILQKEIVCSPQKSLGAGADERCHTIQQEKLDAIIRKQLIREAARIHGFELSDVEVMRQAGPGTIPDDKRLETLVSKTVSLLRAVLEVREGANPDDVYARKLAPEGVSRFAFDDALRAYPTRAGVRAELSRDLLAVARSQLIDQQRLDMYATRLVGLIATRARRDGVRHDVAEAQFWREVLRASKTRVVDQRFELPSIEDLL